MKMQKIKWLFGFVSLLLIQFAHAQVGPCPPGMSEYPSPNGIPSCGPLSSNSAPSQGHWQDRWGALVFSDNDGTSGWSNNQSNEDLAKKEAVANCVLKGGGQCIVELTYWNGCIAVFNGDNRHYSFREATYDKATKGAMKACKKAGHKSCQHFRTECSPAKWISN